MKKGLVATLREESSLLDTVYSQLKDGIVMGKYPPGERLVLSRLSQDIGVSHTPINEALNRLVAEGYVEFMPRRGMKVKEITLQEVFDTYETRKMIELYSAEAMINHAQEDPSYLAELRACTAALRQSDFAADAARDFQPFFEYETRFHQLLLSGTRNRQIFALYCNLKANGMFYYTLHASNRRLERARYLQSLREHDKILNAIESASPRKLREALSIHMQRAEAYLLRALETP